MRSIIIVFEESSREEVTRFLNAKMMIRSDAEWSFESSIVISFYDDAETEFEAEALVALHDRLAGRSPIAVIAHISGKISGDAEVQRLCQMILSHFSGFALDDYTYHFWSLSEIQNAVLQEGHGFFDYDGWYAESTNRRKNENGA
jgi:hypothetical protein